MLASEQPGEADAARRKLVEHLANHRLSLTDIAIRLGERSPSPSFLQGARELSLERQVAIAREARQEAERETAQARQRLEEFQLSLQRSTAEIARAWQSRAQMRARAALAWGIAAIALAIAVIPHLPGLPHRASTPADQASAPSVAGGLAALRPQPGERLGTVLVQDLAIRLTPYDNAGVRAFLNRGMQVVIERQLRVGIESWLLIRSVTGNGWVRASDVLH